jgi:hypothetical protein
MSKAERAERAAMIAAIMEQQHANWHELTEAEQRALFIKATQERCDEMVADGILRVVGTNLSGAKIYGMTEAGRRKARRDQAH